MTGPARAALRGDDAPDQYAEWLAARRAGEAAGDVDVKIAHPTWCDHVLDHEEQYTRWIGRVGPVSDDHRHGLSNVDVELQASAFDDADQTPWALLVFSEPTEAWGHYAARLDADQARRVAALLLDAADKLDTVEVVARVPVTVAG